MSVENIPMNPNAQSETMSSEGSISRDLCGPFSEIRLNARPERGMGNGVQQQWTAEELCKNRIIQSRGLDHPMFNTYEARMQSYDAWPKSLKQKPDKLSEAGFYYTGKGDQTVCFHCGGGFKNWKETDDPWVEHAFWYPKCIHVIRTKGEEFLEQVRQSKHEITQAKESQETTTSAKPSTSTEESIDSEEARKSDEKVIDDARICQICFIVERGVLFLPCGHLVACVKCAPALSTCAVCRQPFTGTVRAFLS